MQSIVYRQFRKELYIIKPTEIHASRDAIRDSVAITYNTRGALITYQASFVGLDKK